MSNNHVFTQKNLNPCKIDVLSLFLLINFTKSPEYVKSTTHQIWKGHLPGTPCHLQSCSGTPVGAVAATISSSFGSSKAG